MNSVAPSNIPSSKIPDFKIGRLTFTLSEYGYWMTFGTYDEASVIQVNPYEGLLCAVDYWLDVLNKFGDYWLEFLNEHALELKVASPTNMLHMVDIIWTSIKHILHILEIFDQLITPDSAQMKVISDKIKACGWWDRFDSQSDLQVSADEFLQKYCKEDDSDSDKESVSENDGMSIGSDHGMAIGGDQNTPNSKTVCDWMIVYVYIKNEGDMKDLLKKLNDQFGKTMEKLIDKYVPRRPTAPAVGEPQPHTKKFDVK